jgi:tetratricopeptide (TPR) repeat protein
LPKEGTGAFAPKESRKKLLHALAEFIFQSARIQPVVVTIEDLQWADPSTLDWFGILAERCAASRVLLVATARDFAAPWKRQSHHLHATLNPLGKDEVDQMISSISTGDRLSAQAIAAITERSAGVPLFVEELTRLAVETGDKSGDEIPTTLADSLMARLDRLGEAKDIAQVGAVLGREFSYGLISALYKGNGDGLQTALERLVSSELVSVRGVSPEKTYRFRHVLIQDAAYASILKSRRRELHSKIASLIVSEFPQIPAEHPEVLARHWSGAGAIREAIASWRATGRAAQKQRAFKEAQLAFQHAMDLVNGLPETVERDVLELPIIGDLAQTYELTHGYAAPETVRAIDRVLILAKRLGHSGRPELLIGSWARAINVGDYNSASSLSDEMMELAGRDGNQVILGFAHMSRIETRFYLGDLVAAEACFLGGSRYFERHAFRQFPGAFGTVLGFASLTAFATGRIETARSRISTAISVAHQTKNPYDLSYGHYMAAALEMLSGESEEAAVAAREAIVLSDQNGFPHIAGAARVILGAASANTGAAAEGARLIEAGLRALADTETRMSLSLSLAYLAQAHALNGNMARASESIEGALQANPVELIYRSEVLRLRGELRLMTGMHKLAVADFREAMEVAHGMGAKSFELRAALGRSRVLVSGGDQVAARNMLEPLYASFAEGFQTRDLLATTNLLKGEVSRDG